MNVREAILRLSRLKLNLQNAWQFYRANADTYENLAKQIAHGVLIATPPPDVTAEQWARTTETTVRWIGAALVASSKVNGLIIGMASAKNATLDEAVGPDGEFTPSGVTDFVTASLDDILAFIRAGREGDELGKDLDRRDYGEDDHNIAFNILSGVKKGNGDGVMHHIHKFLGKKHEAHAHDRSPQILTAWLDIIVPRVRADLEAWVRTQIALK